MNNYIGYFLKACLILSMILSINTASANNDTINKLDTFYVFSDDSNYHKYIGSYHNLNKNSYFHIFRLPDPSLWIGRERPHPIEKEQFGLTFKVNLPDGVYLQVNPFIKNKKNVDEHIVKSCRYVDSVRDGTCKEYIAVYNGFLKRLFGKPFSYWLIREYNYTKGVLNGFYLDVDLATSSYVEGYYKEGQKHGIFIFYLKRAEREIFRVEIYHYDELLFITEIEDGKMKNFIEY